jgi:hypothetical protein
MTATAEITSPYIAFYWDENFAGPRHLTGTDVVYVFEFEGGIVKVGRTADFTTRLSAHRSSPRTRGLDIIRWWAVKSDDPIESESKLIHFAHAHGGTNFMRSKEWFEGVDALEIIRAASIDFGLGEFNESNPMPVTTPLPGKEPTDPAADFLSMESILRGMREFAAITLRMNSGDRA